ncbi:Predicted membrane protein [Raoultella planticola]|uniref:Predicted membrane protein n=1 Tax=Raoultella planticola TaxID=575 RepID=A0A485BBZ0_RAOPL|nr:Predicted membrane protein [Raoultella planticola]
MTLQQWMFSIKGRIGRRDFWIWMAIWVLAMSALFTLAGTHLLNVQTAAFILGVPAVADGGGDDQTPARSR